ncbi:hypothetical protein ACPC37_35135 [Streptomyces griseoincarnatus]|uniref:hypothetical protein n=1 Tax=Actinomycetes TaxID=1760 RepID=UPI0033BC104E
MGSQDLRRFGGTCLRRPRGRRAVVVTTSSAAAPAEEHSATCGMGVDGGAPAASTGLAAPWQAGASEHASRMSTA